MVNATWTTLITNLDYLPGLLVLDYSLKAVKSKYKLLALCADSFPEEGRKALERRGIPMKVVRYERPELSRDFSNDPRFFDCWTKLAAFGLTEYERVCVMDSDMEVRKNMDELMEIPLDAPSLEGNGNRVFAGCPACACNPQKKKHYPKDWVPSNCAYTSQHGDPDKAQVEGATNTAGVGMVNGGLLVVNPSDSLRDLIKGKMEDPDAMGNYEFSDQSLLSDLFYGRWVVLPYVYNALKPARWEGVHSAIFRDDSVKNFHYLLQPKPWQERDGKYADETHAWWWDAEKKRIADEKSRGINDEWQ